MNPSDQYLGFPGNANANGRQMPMNPNMIPQLQVQLANMKQMGAIPGLPGMMRQQQPIPPMQAMNFPMQQQMAQIPGALQMQQMMQNPQFMNLQNLQNQQQRPRPNQIPPQSQYNMYHMNQIPPQQQIPQAPQQLPPRPEPTQQKRRSQSKTSHKQPMIPPIQPPPAVVAPPIPNPNPRVPQPQPPAAYQPPPAISSDVHQLATLIQKIPDDKADLFFKLFECTAGKKKEERFEQLTRSVLPRLTQFVTRAPEILCRLIEKLQHQQNIAKIKEPPIPFVYSKVKGSKPIYKNVMLNWPRFEIQLSAKERKMVTIGSFLRFGNEAADPGISVSVDKIELRPARFGSDSVFYNIAGQKTGHYVVQFNGQMPNNAAVMWFVIQSVEKKRSADKKSYHMLIQELARTHNWAMPADFKERAVLARTSACQGCSFELWRVLDLMMDGEDASCPTCGSRICFNDLQVELDSGVGPEMQIEEDPEMMAARLAFSEQPCLVKSSHMDLEWENVLFGKSQHELETREYEPIVYTNTEEYREVLNSCL